MKYNTELPYVDVTIGGNGIPVRSMIQIFGGTDTSKSSVSLFFAKNFLNTFKNSKLLYVDAEFKVDEVRFNYIMNSFIEEGRVSLVQENRISSVFGIIEKFIKENALNEEFSMVILDTIANIIPDEDSDAGYSGAKLVSSITSKLSILSNIKHKCNSHILILNQVRDNVSGMGHKKTKAPRGRQLSHIVNATIKMNSLKTNLNEYEKIAYSDCNVIKYVLEKNHLFIPKMSGVLVVDDEGVNVTRSIFEFCSEFGIFKKSASWKSLDLSELGEKSVLKFQGYKKFKEIYDNDKIVRDFIHYKIYKRYLNLSPLSFIKIIDKVNEYEEILGLPKTEIPDEFKKYIDNGLDRVSK